MIQIHIYYISKTEVLKQIFRQKGFQEWLRSKFNDGQVSEIIKNLRTFDADGNGYISCNELRTLMIKKVGKDEECANQMVNEWFDGRMDKDGDGKLNYKEFVQFLTGEK